MLLPSLLNGEYFVGGGDVKTQWYPFYILNRRSTIMSLKDKTLPFYSFVLFLGSNLWASKSSYGLFDLYNIITYLFDANFFAIYDVLSFIKIVVSGISFYLLCSYIYKNNKVSVISAVCYALSSYGVYFTSQPGFLSFYSIAPLLFLGVEHYLNENKKYLFIIITFLLLVTNYYLFYATSIFLPIYFIYRYYNINKRLKGLFKSALILVLHYLVGALMAAVVALPAFMYITQNERVGGINTNLAFNDLVVILHLFIAAFVPNQTYIYGNNIFNEDSHTMKEVLLYAGSIISLLVPQFITDKEKEYKVSTIILYLVMLFLAFTPFASSLMNGFSEPCFRWFFLFIMMNILTSAHYLNNLNSINKKNLITTFIVEIVLIIVCYIVCAKYRGLNLGGYKLQITIFIILIIFTSFNLYSLLKGKNYFFAITYIELLLCTLFYGNKSRESSVTKEEINSLTNVIADSDNIYYLNDYLNSLDENNSNSYFRVYVPYDSLYWSFSHDLSIVYNINGLLTYDSTYAQSFNKMRNLGSDGVRGYIDWEFNITNDEVMSFLNTKYSITLTEDEIPFSDYEIVDDTYRGTLIVAENKNYRPLATSYSKAMTYETFEKEYDNDISLLNEYVVTDSDISSLLGNSNAYLENITYYDNTLTGTVHSDDNTFMVLGLPYDEGWKILVNGKEVDYIECNGGVIGFAINAGDNNIEMYFTPQGFKAGAIGTACGVMAFAGIIIVDVMKKRRTV